MIKMKKIFILHFKVLQKKRGEISLCVIYIGNQNYKAIQDFRNYFNIFIIQIRKKIKLQNCLPRSRRVTGSAMLTVSYSKCLEISRTRDTSWNEFFSRIREDEQTSVETL